MKEIFKKLIIDFQTSDLPEIIPRDIKLTQDSKLRKAIVITGPRRAGKSYFLFQCINETEESVENIVYINFEDSRLPPLQLKDLNLLLDAYLELFPDNTPVFFLDEIQNVPEWERFVRTLLDKGYQVHITGSNAKLLSKEIATALRGRSITYQLFPFSPKEILKQKSIALDKNWEFKNKNRIAKLMETYFVDGGFPEILLTTTELTKRKITEEYFSTLLYKDLAERYNIRNTTVLKLLLQYLANNYASYFTINAFFNYCKSMGIKTSTSTIHDIVHALDGIYYAFFIRKHDSSIKKQEVNPKKVYIVDNSYITRLILRKDWGRLLENSVAIHLLSKEMKINYFSEKGAECDFIIFSDKVMVIQVSWELHEKNKLRELKGLLKAMERFNLNKGTIITRNQTETIQMGKKKISVVPFWKWVLN